MGDWRRADAALQGSLGRGEVPEQGTGGLGLTGALASSVVGNGIPPLTVDDAALEVREEAADDVLQEEVVPLEEGPGAAGGSTGPWLAGHGPTSTADRWRSSTRP